MAWFFEMPPFTYVLLALTTVLPAVYLAVWFRCTAPKTGTLEWITAPQARPLRLDKRQPFSLDDLLPMVVLVLWCMAVFLLSGVLTIPGYVWISRNALPTSLEAAIVYGLLPITGVLSFYLLLRSMGTACFMAAVAVLLACVQQTWDPVLLAVCGTSLLFLWRFCSAPRSDDSIQNGLDLLGAAAVCGVGSYFSPACFWLGVLELLIILLVGAIRIRHSHVQWRAAVLPIWHFAVLMLFSLLTRVPGLLLQQLHPGREDFWLWLMVRWSNGLIDSIAFLPLQQLVILWPFLTLAITAAISCAAQLRQGSGSALYALMTLLLSLGLLLLTQGEMLAFGLAAVLAVMTRRLKQRGHPVLACFGWIYLAMLCILFHLFAGLRAAA